MALFDKTTRSKLENLVNDADEIVRSEFHLKIIADEDDYTSNLTLRIRDLVQKNLPLKASIVKVAPDRMEQAWGIDACIILADHNNDECKICLFEAKTDRVRWDYLERKAQSSLSHFSFFIFHFSTQLDRQLIPHKMGFAIWEQFYSSKANGHIIGNKNPYGSTCILHTDAINHNGVHPNSIVWRDHDIDSLAQTNLPTKMGELVKSVCECNIGVAMSVKDVCIAIQETMPVKHLLVIESLSSKDDSKSIASIVQNFPS